MESVTQADACQEARFYHGKYLAVEWWGALEAPVVLVSAARRSEGEADASSHGSGWAKKESSFVVMMMVMMMDDCEGN